jgi:hypothetical protein
VEEKEVKLLEEAKDAMQKIRIKMCKVIKGKIFMKVSEDAAGKYEISRKKAMREAF